MRTTWGIFCAVIAFAGIQAVGRSNDGPTPKTVSQYTNNSGVVSQAQTPSTKQAAIPLQTSATLSASAIALLIIQQSRTAYYATGHRLS
jgi:hypothetical protein